MNLGDAAAASPDPIHTEAEIAVDRTPIKPKAARIVRPPIYPSTKSMIAIHMFSNIINSSIKS